MTRPSRKIKLERKLQIEEAGVGGGGLEEGDEVAGALEEEEGEAVGGESRCR